VTTEKLRFPCENCSKNLSVSSEQVGKSLKCPACGSKVVVPAPALLPEIDLGLEDLPAAQYELPTSSPASPQAYTDATSGNFSPEVKQARSSPPTVSMGRSVGGLAAACAVGFMCTIAWILVVVFTEREVGILAWGLGGLIGFVAGVIAKNASPIYCGLASGVAVMSVLAAKLIMAGGIMAAHFSMNFADQYMDEFMDSTPEQERLLHAQADQWLAEKTLDATDELSATQFNAQYFGDETELVAVDDEADIEEGLGGIFEFRKKLKESVANLNDADQQQLLKQAMERHPNWIQDEDCYHAFCHVLLEDQNALSEELQEHAANEVRDWSDEGKQNYTQNNAPRVLFERTTELRSIVAKRIRESTPEQIDDAFRKAMTLDPEFKSGSNEFIAMMHKLNEQQRFQGKLQQHVDAELKQAIEHEYPEEFDNIDMEAYALERREVGAIVNQELSTLNGLQRASLVEWLSAEKPGWIEDPNDAVLEFEAAKAELGDGTFLGSLKQVFGMYDFLWLFLGATTAFGTARRQAATA
jgi:DNA-directed RNA polymerase subunit RPC12/RpoP